jgi:molecular chaperone DnaJ
VHVQVDQTFTMDGQDLRLNVPVTFVEAALGADIDVPTVNGGVVRVRIPAGTGSGRTLRVKGRGLNSAKHTGDLLVTIQIVVPQRLNEAAQGALAALAEALGPQNPRADLLARAESRSGGTGAD